MKRKIIIIAGVLALIGLGMGMKFFLESFKPEEKKPEKKAVKRYVHAKGVVYSDVNTTVNGTGRLLSFNQFDLSTEVGGQLAQGAISLKKGQAFRKGQLVARIVNDEFTYALKAKKSRFLNSLANILPDLKIDYKENYDEWRIFFNAVDTDKKLPKLPSIEQEKLKVFLATRNILSDYYSIKADEVRQDKYSIRAPFDGVFSDVYAEAGAIVNMGSRIARILRTTAVELEVPVEMDFSKWISIGQEVKVLDGQKKYEWKGKVVRKSKFVDPTTQAISVFVKVQPDKDHALLTGMYMYAQFSGIIVEKVMQMPRNSIYNGNMVYTVEDGKLKKRTIKVHKLNETTALFSGLSTGEMLIVEPVVNAKEGSLIEIISQEKEETEKEVKENEQTEE